MGKDEFDRLLNGEPEAHAHVHQHYRLAMRGLGGVYIWHDHDHRDHRGKPDNYNRFHHHAPGEHEGREMPPVLDESDPLVDSTPNPKAVQRPEPYPGNPETWNGEWLEHPIDWIKECFRRAHDTLTHRENSYAMSIPVQRWDPDIVLGDAIEELERLRAENARLKQDNADAYRRLGIAVGTE